METSTRTKRFSLIMALALIVSIIAMCFAGVNVQAASTRTVTDGAGNKVTVPKNIKRYAVGAGPYWFVTWAVDGGSSKRLVARQGGDYAYFDKFKGLDNHWSKVDSKAVGADFSINVEEIIKLKPDIIFLWDTQTNEAEKFKEAGITPVMVNSAVDGYKAMTSQIKMIGNVLNRQKQAKKLCAEFTKSQKYFQKKAKTFKGKKHPKVLYMQTSKLSVATKVQGYTRYFKWMGAQNVTAKSTSTDKASDNSAGLGYWMNTNMEQIAEWNPDIIILSNFDTFTPQDFYDNKIEGQDWSEINAVKNHRVYKDPQDITYFNINYVETPLYNEWLAKVVNPKAFKDLDVKKDFKAFYKKMYGYKMTDKMVDEVFRTDMNKVKLTATK